MVRYIVVREILNIGVNWEFMRGGYRGRLPLIFSEAARMRSPEKLERKGKWRSDRSIIILNRCHQSI